MSFATTRGVPAEAPCARELDSGSRFSEIEHQAARLEHVTSARLGDQVEKRLPVESSRLAADDSGDTVSLEVVEDAAKRLSRTTPIEGFGELVQPAALVATRLENFFGDLPRIKLSKLCNGSHPVSLLRLHLNPSAFLSPSPHLVPAQRGTRLGNQAYLERFLQGFRDGRQRPDRRIRASGRF